MARGNTTQLREEQELLLSRYFDGEAALFDRFRARRLLATNSLAAQFFTSLQHIKTETECTFDAASVQCDLWNRISARIEAEEKAAIYLGQRTTPSEEERSVGFFERFASLHALAGGLSGAAVAAVLLLTISPTTSDKNVAVINVDSSTMAAAPNRFQPVGLGAEGQSAPQKARRVTPMELDWMRGDGPLKIIQHSGDPSGVIWVQRNRSLHANNQATPTPLGTSRHNRGLDGSSADRSE